MPMLDYETLREQLIPTHGFVGVLAVVIGIVTLSLPKRAGGHSSAGRAFLVAMALAIAVSAPVVFARHNLFLMGIGLIVVYHAIVAWRLARLQPPLHLPGRIDRMTHPGFGILFLVFTGYGAWIVISGFGMGLVVVVIGGISLGSVWHFHRFMNQECFNEGEWISEHIRGMAATFIASLTAFGAAASPRLAPSIPPPVLWLAPTLSLTPLFVLFGRGIRGSGAPPATPEGHDTRN